MARKAQNIKFHEVELMDVGNSRTYVYAPKDVQLTSDGFLKLLEDAELEFKDLRGDGGPFLYEGTVLILSDGWFRFDRDENDAICLFNIEPDMDLVGPSVEVLEMLQPSGEPVPMPA